MASTYTTNLRLTKQGDGDNPNSWGEVLNQQVISLVDDAIAGYTTIDIGASASVTLTNQQGASDQSRSAVLEFKGTVGGVATSIFALIPNTPKVYVVKNSVSYNNTTDAVILRVEGNDGCTIPADTVAMYMTNGTTVVPITQTTFTNITASGNLAVLGTASISGAAAFKSAVSVSGNIDTAGNVSVGGTVTITGNAVQAVNAGVCASAFYGSGANLTGITAVATGVVLPWAGTSTSAPSGYLTCYGQAVSRSTYADLFGVLSSVYGDGDGSSTFNLPDLRGRVIAGKDDMGGTSADRLTNAVAGQNSEGVNGDNLGAAGGLETNTLSVSTLPSHAHDYSQYSSGAAGSSGGGASTGGNTDAETSTKGGGLAHNNVQPTLILNYIIKT